MTGKVFRTESVEAHFWSDCHVVESVPGRMSGVPVVKRVRRLVQDVVEKYEGRSPIAEIADNFNLEAQDVHDTLNYAAWHKPVQPAH